MIQLKLMQVQALRHVHDGTLGLISSHTGVMSSLRRFLGACDRPVAVVPSLGRRPAGNHDEFRDGWRRGWFRPVFFKVVLSAEPHRGGGAGRCHGRGGWRLLFFLPVLVLQLRAVSKRLRLVPEGSAPTTVALWATLMLLFSGAGIGKRGGCGGGGRVVGATRASLAVP